MVAKNDPIAENRRIVVEFFDASGALLPGISFSHAAHEVQISQNGAAWVDASADAVAIGGGAYYVELSQAETNFDGSFVGVKLSKATYADQASFEPMGDPIAKSEPSAVKRRVPVAFYDNSGALLPGQAFSHAAHEVQVTAAGSAWADASNDAVAIGGGYYYVELSQAETNFDGSFGAVKLSKATYRDQVGIFDLSRGLSQPVNLVTATQSLGGSSTAVIVGDVALVWSNTTGDADLSKFGSDLSSDRGLMTAMLLSLFTDRRAETDDKPPSGDSTDRRGWWADEFAAVEGDLFGSRLWLLDRSTLSNETVLRARQYVLEAWQWMIDDKVVASIPVTVTRLDAPAGILIAGELLRPGRDAVSFRFAHTWDHLQEDM